MKILIISCLLFITTATDAQFYNAKIGFQYFSVDTVSNELNFICETWKGESYQCEFVETFVYKGYAQLENIYYDEIIHEDLKIEVDRPKDISLTFQSLEKELRKDTIWFQSPKNSNYIINHLSNNQYILSTFNSNNFNDHRCSKLVSFNKILLDENIPIMIASLEKDEFNGIVAFYDKNHKFRMIDTDGIFGKNNTRFCVNLNSSTVDSIINIWENTVRQESFRYFNFKNHSFSIMPQAGGVFPSYNDQFEIEKFIVDHNGHDYNSNIEIPNIKKFTKGQLLKAINGKVFNNGKLKFINNCGAAVKVEHDTRYNDSYITYFKELQLLEDVVILYNGEYTIIPFEGHFKISNRDGDLTTNIDYDFALGKEYIRRLLSESQNMIFHQFNGKWGIRDNLNGKQLIPAVYDTIWWDSDQDKFSIIVTKKGKLLKVYNAMFEEIFRSSKVIDFKIYHRSVLFLNGNEVFYLASNGQKSTKIPLFPFINDCGFNVFYTYSIKKSKDTGYNIFISNDIENEEKFTANELLLNINLSLDSLTFLDGKITYHDSSNALWSKYVVGYKKDSVKIIHVYDKASSKYSIENEFIADEIKLLGQNHPIMYRVGNLWGYYGITEKPKYKSILPFNGYFAKVENNKGKMGWVNALGIEYWD